MCDPVCKLFKWNPLIRSSKEPHDLVQCSQSTTINNSIGFGDLDRCPLVLLAGVELGGKGRRCAVDYFRPEKVSSQSLGPKPLDFSSSSILLLPKRYGLRPDSAIIRFQSFITRLAAANLVRL